MTAPLPSPEDDELSIEERVALLGQAISTSSCTVDEAAQALSSALTKEAAGEILVMLELGMEAREMLKRAGHKYD